MFQHSQQFQHATQLFYSMQYQQGLELINKCISEDSNNSILYSNRALFYSQLGYIDEAFSDLNIAIELNYLNYIGYFNMFSLLMRCQRFQEAFQNLCCSLSCLYLIQAKTKKSQLDASKAIKYAQNNLQAHVLKGLIHLQNGKYKLALNQLQWACQINPSNEIVRNIKQLIYRKMNPGLQVSQGQMLNLQQQGVENRRGIIRLQSSYSYEQGDREQQLRDRISEFNQIYNKLNEYQGTITTKVPKQYQEQAHQNQHQNQQQNQPQNQQKNQKQNQQLIFQQQKSPIVVESQTQNVDKNILILDEDIKDDHNERQLTPLENANRQSQHRQQQAPIVHQDNVNNMSRYSSGSGIIDGGAATPLQMSLAPEPGQYPSYIQQQSNVSVHHQDSISEFHSINNPQSKSPLQKCQSQSTNSNILQFESMIQSQLRNRLSESQPSLIENKNHQENFQSFINLNAQQNVEQIQAESLSQITNSLYPRPENALLQFSILKLEILEKSPQQISKLENLYCIANYLNVNEGKSQSNFKLRTACRKGQLDGAEWNQTFQPVPIPQQPECMKIKVYNKKYSSYRDDLIGQMQVQITTHGLVKLPLFNKNGQLAATLLMNLELVIKPIQEEDEKQEQC